MYRGERCPPGAWGGDGAARRAAQSNPTAVRIGDRTETQPCRFTRDTLVLRIQS